MRKVLEMAATLAVIAAIMFAFAGTASAEETQPYGRDCGINAMGVSVEQFNGLDDSTRECLVTTYSITVPDGYTMAEDYSIVADSFYSSDTDPVDEQIRNAGGIPVNGLSTQAVETMLDSGWYGDPTDGFEALYPPKEQAPNNAVGKNSRVCWEKGEFQATDGCLGF